MCQMLLLYLVPGPVPLPPPPNATTPTSVVLRWTKPPMPNGVITSYVINLVVLTPAPMTSSRKKRQTASFLNRECIIGGSDKNITVDPPVTNQTVNNLSKGLCIIDD